MPGDGGWGGAECVGTGRGGGGALEVSVHEYVYVGVGEDAGYEGL